MSENVEDLDLVVVLAPPSSPLYKQHVFNTLNKYLFGDHDKNEIMSRLLAIKGKSSFCTTKWIGECVAIKCVTCQGDPTCAICLDCFFESNHVGHQFKLTNTFGGCCDCGDSTAWKQSGTCSRHGQMIEFELNELNCFDDKFLQRLSTILRHCVKYMRHTFYQLNGLREISFVSIVEFMGDLLRIDPGFRCLFSCHLTDATIKLWITQHQFLPVEAQRAMNSLWLSMLLSPKFKKRFADCYYQAYVISYLPNRESKDWSIANLSVQLFTYPEFALKVVHQGFLGKVLSPILDSMYHSATFGVLHFQAFDQNVFSTYMRVMGDMGYLLSHVEVFDYLLENPKAAGPIFNAMRSMHYMNCIEFRNEHILYELTGCRTAFAVDSAFTEAVTEFLDYTKSVPVNRMIYFYRVLNNYINENLDTLKQNLHLENHYRSFHIPLIRFLGGIIQIDWIIRVARLKFDKMSKNHPQSDYLKSLVTVLEEYSVGADGTRDSKDDELDDSIALRSLNLFDEEVIVFALQCTIATIRFSQEIRNNIWVYSGEEMNLQYDMYNSCRLFSRDVHSLQVFSLILALKRMDGQLLAFIYKEVFQDYEEGDMDYNNICSYIFNIVNPQHVVKDYPDFFRRQYPPPLQPLVDVEVKIYCYFYILYLLVQGTCITLVTNYPPSFRKKEYIERLPLFIYMDVVCALCNGVREYPELLAKVQKRWKHHPNLEDIIEDVCVISHSRINDKTYVRLKRDKFNYIDVLWAPHELSNYQSILDDAKGSHISYLGPDYHFYNRQCHGLQRLMLEMMGGNKFFNIILRLYSIFSIHNLQEEIQNECKSILEFKMGPICAGKPPSDLLGEFENLLLHSLKMIKSIFDNYTISNTDRVMELIQILEGVSTKMDDDVGVAAYKYFIDQIRNKYNLPLASARVEVQPLLDVKQLQQEYLERFRAKQQAQLLAMEKKFEIEVKDAAKGRIPIEEQICVLCREEATIDKPMVYMCTISRNSILRRCVSGIGSYNIRASFPLSNSILATCGHMAHQDCILRHSSSETQWETFVRYRISKSPDEFFCPVCKGYCNFILSTGLNHLVAHVNWKACTSTLSISTPTIAKYEPYPQYTHFFQCRWEMEIQDSETVSITKQLLPNSNPLPLRCRECSLENHLVTDNPPSCDATCMENVITIHQVWKSERNQKLEMQVGDALHRMFEEYKLTNEVADLPIYFSNYHIPRAIGNRYCRDIFSCRPTFFGVHNWRHVNAGIKLDPLLWLLYNECLATFTVKRDRLLTPNSIFAALINWVAQHRTSFFEPYSQWKEAPLVKYMTLSEDLMSQSPTKMAFPSLTSAYNGETNFSEVLMQQASTEQIQQLVSNLPINTDTGQDPNIETSHVMPGLYINSAYPESAREFAKLASKAAVKKIDVLNFLGSTLYPSPWSIDIIREWLLYYFSNYVADPLEIQSQAFYFLWIGSMQVMERFVLEALKSRYISWLKDAATDETAATLNRMAMVEYCYKHWLEPEVTFGNIPVNLDNIKWMDFDKHRSAFAGQNRLLLNVESDPVSDLSLELSGSVVVTEEMAAIHNEIIKAIMVPLPTGHSREELEQNEEIAAQFLLSQINKLIEIRDLHAASSFANHGDKFQKLLRFVIDNKVNDPEVLEFIKRRKFQESPDPHQSNKEEKRVFKNDLSTTHINKVAGEWDMYTGSDFSRRLNQELYRHHINVPMFEIFRMWVPKPRHLISFLSGDVAQEIYNSKLSAADQEVGLYPHVAKVLEHVWTQLHNQGLLGPFQDQYVNSLWKQIQETLALYLDVVFWILQVRNPNLEAMKQVAEASSIEKFNSLIRYLELSQLITSENCKAICSRIFDPTVALVLRLQSNIGLETEAPLVCNYSRFEFKLPMDPWDLIRNVSKRHCPHCGSRPQDPALCLLCNSVFCASGTCSAPPSAQIDEYRLSSQVLSLGFSNSDMSSTLHALVIHGKNCGGGQCIYLQPYSSKCLYLDMRRMAHGDFLYADAKGIDDLTRRHGPMKLCESRVESIINLYSQGKMAQAIFNVTRPFQ
ncbi:bifunctional E3 ubiquitin-protein ligase UBR1-like/Zinc finger [Babesia duncani]|uniref:E3 ubiquitin-protein ligase n=1 Tax=Babesia duncani TaxID=323732 RepID=A0AAD9UQU4_9APIC|nr:bifunctional E3 ubiquitin-protein ligase UBR1-like/Zinc finger [Babesia duncani]